MVIEEHEKKQSTTEQLSQMKQNDHVEYFGKPINLSFIIVITNILQSLNEMVVINRGFLKYVIMWGTGRMLHVVN
jgi:hypothetical protein